MKTPKVIDVKAQKDFMLTVCFDNGISREFDVKPLLSMPIYKPLQNVELFQKVSVDQFGGITWGNNIDCCRDTLYAS